MEGARVRKAALSDAAAVASLIAEFAGELGRSVDPDHANRLLAAGWGEFPPSLHAWVAWRGETPVGVAVCVESFSTFSARPSLMLEDLYITKTDRGAGVSRCLLDAVMEFGSANGYPRLDLTCSEELVKFYVRLGAGATPRTCVRFTL